MKTRSGKGEKTKLPVKSKVICRGKVKKNERKHEKPELIDNSKATSCPEVNACELQVKFDSPPSDETVCQDCKLKDAIIASLSKGRCIYPISFSICH